MLLASCVSSIPFYPSVLVIKQFEQNPNEHKRTQTKLCLNKQTQTNTNKQTNNPKSSPIFLYDGLWSSWWIHIPNKQSGINYIKLHHLQFENDNSLNLLMIDVEFKKGINSLGKVALLIIILQAPNSMLSVGFTKPFIQN